MTNRMLTWLNSASQLGSGYLDAGDTPVYQGVFEAAADSCSIKPEGFRSSSREEEWM